MNDGDIAGMDIVDVAALVVDAYPGGCKSLAPRIGKNHNSLGHELNPPEGSTAKLGLRTAQQITLKSRDLRILMAFAASCSCMVLPVPDVSDEDAGIGEQLARLAQEFGDVLQAISTALRDDRRVSDNELANITRQWSELLAVGEPMFRALAANNLRHGGKGLAQVVGGRLRQAA